MAAGDKISTKDHAEEKRDADDLKHAWLLPRL
jgi:hypothetical protein